MNHILTSKAYFHRQVVHPNDMHFQSHLIECTCCNGVEDESLSRLIHENRVSQDSHSPMTSQSVSASHAIPSHIRGRGQAISDIIGQVYSRSYHAIGSFQGQGLMSLTLEKLEIFSPKNFKALLVMKPALCNAHSIFQSQLQSFNALQP